MYALAALSPAAPGEKKNQKTKKPVTNLQTFFFVFCFAFLSTASGDYAN
jgi:hypothetical protein